MKHESFEAQVAATQIADFPLSAGQFRCWFTNQMRPGTPTLNVSVRWELNGSLQTSNLERAFQTVIERHEILRTRFVETDAGPRQQVMDAADFKLASVDLRTMDHADQLRRIEEIAYEFCDRPFDLGEPGLIRASLIRLSADKAIVVLVVHRICFDGHSIGVLGREVGTIAQALEAGEAHGLPELPLQYGDFTLWQEEYFASGVLEEQSAYWCDHLKDAPYFALEPDKPRPPVRGTKGASVKQKLPADFGDRLEAAAKELDVSKFALGAAVFSACLSRASGSEDVVFGCQVSGRHAVELEPLVGMLTNNLVLRLPAPSKARFADHISASKATIQDGLLHQDLPFNLLVEKMNPPRDPSRTPLVSINFSLQNVFMETRDYGDFELRSTPSHEPGAYYDINVAVMSRPTGWHLSVEYATDLFEESTALGLLELIEAGFRTVFDNANAAIADLALPAILDNRTERNRAAEIAIERVLLTHKMVGDVFVAKARDGDAHYAFVVPENTGIVTLESLPTRILADFAGHAVLETLTGVSVLASLPRDENNQVDTRALRPPRGASVVVQQDQADSIGAELSKDWCELLELPSVNPSDNFFHLGGHSVLMLRLLTRIRDRWGIELEIGEVFENAHLADMVDLLQDRIGTTAPVAPAKAEPEPAPAAPAVPAAKDWRVLNLSKGGTKAPLIAINNAATAQAFGAESAFDRPALCIRVNKNGEGFSADNAARFEDVATAYADVIRGMNTDAPLVLYGNCVHGNLALEAARQLKADGHDIAAVVMKDVWEPGYTDSIRDARLLNIREKLHAVRTRFRAMRRGEVSPAAFLGSYRIIRATGVLRLAQAAGLIDRVKRSDLEVDQERFISRVSHLRDHYRPERVDFPVLHIVTSATPTASGFSPSIGWENVVDPAHLKTVHLDQAKVIAGKRIGIDAMVREIESFAKA
ncbi:MAG: condensation protein [Rhodobacteraceae bacterium]|nr:condensation protein [Paracoccaceae bacterium]